jgi:hypothetical protein
VHDNFRANKARIGASHFACSVSATGVEKRDCKYLLGERTERINSPITKDCNQGSWALLARSGFQIPHPISISLLSKNAASEENLYLQSSVFS